MEGTTPLLCGYTATWGILIRWAWLLRGVAALIAALQAVDEVERSGNKAAAFHLAQRLETDVSYK